MSASAGVEPREALRRSRWLRWLAELAFAVGLYLALSSWQSRGALSDDGDTLAPPFALRTLDGRVTRLADFAGRGVLLHFWAPWCGVCRAEISMLSDLYAELPSDQALLTVVAADDEASVREFVRERRLNYPVLLGTPEVLAAYGISAFPTNYVIDSRGRIRSHTVGMSTGLGLKARLGCAR